MECYSAIKRNVFESVLMRWMNLEPIIQSKVSQKQKDKYRILTHIYGIEKNGSEEFIYRAAMESQWTPGVGDGQGGLACCDSWGRTESDIGIHMSPPFWTSLPSASASHTSWLIQSSCLSFLSHTANSSWLFYIWQCKFPCYSFHTSHCLLPSLHVHKSILYVCFSIAAL